MAPKQDLLDRADRAADWADSCDSEAHGADKLRAGLLRTLATYERGSAVLYRRLAGITPAPKKQP